MALQSVIRTGNQLYRVLISIITAVKLIDNQVEVDATGSHFHYKLIFTARCEYISIEFFIIYYIYISTVCCAQRTHFAKCILYQQSIL